METVSETFILATWDIDNFAGVRMNGDDVCFPANYLVLAGNDMPTVLDALTHNDKNVTKEAAESQGCRIAYGISYSEVESDDYFYYLNEGNHYSLLSYKGLKTDALSVPSTFNEKPVLTILKWAIMGDSRLKKIVIEDGMTTIRPYGIVCYRVDHVVVPLSVSLINANGIVSDNNKMKIYAYAASKPIDWDSNWTNVLGNVSFGVTGELSSNNFFTYFTSNNAVTLISYDSKSSNIYIPSEIDGNPVTTIKSGFYTRNGGADIYIPSSVTTIEERAFVNQSSRRFTFVLEVSDKPSGWNDNWYYSTYNSSSSSYSNKNWGNASSFNYCYNEDFAYSAEGQNVTLLSHHCKTDTVKIPRAIEGKTVNKISGYCFYYDTSATIYVPQEVTMIEQLAFEFNSSNSSRTLKIMCEANSKPSGWDYNFAYNSYTSSQSYISIKYNSSLGY